MTKFKLFPLVLLSALLVVSSAFALNLERRPIEGDTNFFEILDVETMGQGHIVTVGVDGLHVFGFNHFGVPTHVGDHPEERIYNVWGEAGRVIGARRTNGATIFDMSDPAQPQILHRYNEPGVSVEDALRYEERWWLAAHNTGLVALDTLNPEQAATYLTGELSDAWALTMHPDGLLYVADGAGGLKVVRVTQGHDPSLVASLETTSAAVDVKYENDLLAVAVGQDGIDVFDITDPEDPHFLRNLPTPAFSNHISFSQERIAVATWDQVRVYNANTGALMGYQYSTTRAMGVLFRHNDIYVADWSFLVRYEYGYINGPDLEVRPRRIDLSFVPEDSDYDTVMVVKNVGHAPLEIDTVTRTSQAYEITLNEHALDPGDSTTLDIRYTHDPGLTGNTEIRFLSNDTDEATLRRRVVGHGGWLALGDPAPDFTVERLNGSDFTLSEHRGEVVLIVFWASW